MSHLASRALERYERINLLCDAGSIRPLDGRQAQRGELPVAVVAARGQVDGRDVVCYAQDSRLAGGSVGVAEADTVVKALRQASRRRVPVIAFLESAGARLQEGVAALGGFGRIFTENVALSGHVPQISVITGTAAGGGCYSPALTDFVVMTERASMFLTGPRVVNEALGEDVGADELGGVPVHERNGVCQLVAADDDEAAATVRSLLRYLPSSAGERPPRSPSAPPGPDAVERIVPAQGRLVYDVRAVVHALVDEGYFLEFSRRWARNLVTGFARIEGRPVGIIANQPRHLGGVLDIEAAQKGARFVRTCDAFGLPLVVLVDTPGFMPGLRQEGAGVIRHGAGLLRAFVEARVARVTVILRKAYGGAYITMNSREVGADLALAWPGAEIGIMGPRAAVRILYRRDLASVPEPEPLAAELADRYAAAHLTPERAVELGLIDGVIAPQDTRAALVRGLDGGGSSGGAWRARVPRRPVVAARRRLRAMRV